MGLLYPMDENETAERGTGISLGSTPPKLFQQALSMDVAAFMADDASIHVTTEAGTTQKGPVQVAWSSTRQDDCLDE